MFILVLVMKCFVRGSFCLSFGYALLRFVYKSQWKALFLCCRRGKLNLGARYVVGVYANCGLPVVVDMEHQGFGFVFRFVEYVCEHVHYEVHRRHIIIVNNDFIHPWFLVSCVLFCCRLLLRHIFVASFLSFCGRVQLPPYIIYTLLELEFEIKSYSLFVGCGQ